MKFWMLFLSFTLILTHTAFGQLAGPPPAAIPRAVLTGTVYDPNGSVIMHAELLARSSTAEYWATTNTEASTKWNFLWTFTK